MNNGQNNIKQELENAKKLAEEYLNNWKRERADFLNYKKEETKIMAEFAKYAARGVLLEIIEILDDLEIAMKHNSGDGIRQIYEKFLALMRKHGIERIAPVGPFDPTMHEAVETDSADGGGGKEIEEVRAGYTMHGKVIRPTRVRIIKK